MQMNNSSFQTSFGTIAAMVGSAVGLGNIWRFPYMAGSNGGAAFILVYILFSLFLGLTLFLGEIVMGRHAKADLVTTFKKMAPNTKWYGIGAIGLIASVIIYSFYSVVAGWTIYYVYQSATGAFAGQDAAQIQEGFASFVSNPVLPLITQFLLVFLTGSIVVIGVSKGIERFSKILMPILLLLLILLCFRSLTLEGSWKGVQFLLTPDFSKIGPGALLAALGQSLFSMSVGMGSIVMYGAYTSSKMNLLRMGLIVVAVDVFIAILAGFAIFPAVFAFDLEPATGPSLVFETLPLVFNQMSFGLLFATLFFVLLSIAAITSTISLLEVSVVFIQNALRTSRLKATILCSFVVLLGGVICALSFGPLKHILWGGKNIFDLFSYTASDILLPLVCLLTCIFIAWKAPKSIIQEQLTNGNTVNQWYVPIFYFIVKFVAPIAIVFVLISSLNL